jgi:DNA (cytosine-5)-methyltransferase 1
MKVLDLFSGIGGFSLGLKRAGMHTVAFCEIDKFCQKVLSKHWPDVPIYDDIKTLTSERLEQDGIEPIDVICGGFPCQPFSVAGQKKGTADNRDLWPEMFRLIKECQPTWVIGENVAGFVNMELERTALDLESEGYEVQPLVIPACAIGAPHRRDRVWIIAYSNSQDVERQREISCRTQKKIFISKGCWGETQSPVCGGGNGIPHRMDRLRTLGNAVVPQIPEIIGKVIIEAMRKE